MSSRRTSWSFVLLLLAWLLLAALAAVAAMPIGAQPSRSSSPVAPQHATDSLARRCLDVGWLAPSATCEGRVLNAAGLAVLGAGAGALTGFVGGAIAPGSCLGGGERNAVRGAMAGAAIGALFGVLAPHVSRHERASREVATTRDRAERRAAPRPWSWRDVRPALVALGGVAATGALVGGVQGSRAPSPCAGGTGGGALQGAGVYAAGGVTTVAGSLLVVRFLF